MQEANDKPVIIPKIDTKELESLFAIQPEVEVQIRCYKEVMHAKAMMVSELDKRINKHRGTIGSFFSFFKKSSEYQINKDIIEKATLTREMYYNNKYYEHWLKRKEDFNKQLDFYLAEYDKNFEEVLEKAKKINHPVVQDYIAKYHNDNNDSQLKVEYYLFLKQCVINEDKKVGKNGVLKSV